MKAVLGSLLVVALGVMPSTGQRADKKDEKETAHGPRMEIEPESYDFGTVKQNQKLVHDFEIKNSGSEDLVIGRISTTCGCTAARRTPCSTVRWR